MRFRQKLVFCGALPAFPRFETFNVPDLCSHLQAACMTAF